MSSLLQQRCLHHPGREAVARCPECRRYFCRECVVEHDDRLLCAACLEQWNRARVVRKVRWGFVGEWLIAGGSLMVGWMFFYFMGQALLAIPDAMHEGTIWRKVLPEAAEKEAAEGGVAHPDSHPHPFAAPDDRRTPNTEVRTLNECSSLLQHPLWFRVPRSVFGVRPSSGFMESSEIQRLDAPWDHQPVRTSNAERRTSNVEHRIPKGPFRSTLDVGSSKFDVSFLINDLRVRFIESRHIHQWDVLWSQEPGNAPRSAESQIPNPKSQIPNPQSDICPRFCLPPSASCLARL